MKFEDIEIVTIKLNSLGNAQIVAKDMITGEVNIFYKSIENEINEDIRDKSTILLVQC